MARMIEALKQAEARRAQAPETPTPCPPEAAPAAGAEAEMSFIEVGGNGKPMTASPDVLAAPGPRTPAPAVPAPPAEGGLRVALRPWQGLRPASRLAPELLAYHQPEHPVSKQYQALCEDLLAGPDAGAAQVLLLTAARDGVGATTVLLNLAVSACGAGRRRVAAVDLNLKRPALAARLGLPATPGLREVLAGTAAPEHALQPTAVPGLYALTAAAGAGLPPALTAEALRWLARWLRERCDVVLVDGPPWEEGPELAALAVLADGVYPVLAEAEAQAPAVSQMLHAITRRGGRLRGLLHTQRAA